MATQTAVVGAWACPWVEAQCSDGGFDYSYDDVLFPGGPPLDSCVTTAPLDLVGRSIPTPVQGSAKQYPTGDPDTSWTVEQIKWWMFDNGIEYKSSDTKATLLVKVHAQDTQTGS